MNFDSTVQNGILLITLEGKLDINSADDALTFVRERISDKRNKVIIKLEKVPHISSLGLRMILVLAQELERRYAGTLHVTCLQPAVKRVFEITQLTREIDIFQTDKEAIDSLLKNDTITNEFIQ